MSRVGPYETSEVFLKGFVLYYMTSLALYISLKMRQKQILSKLADPEFIKEPVPCGGKFLVCGELVMEGPKGPIVFKIGILF